MSLTHDQLPLPDYDHIDTGHLPGRISPLNAEQVGQLLEFEREHANRLPVVQVLERRVAALESGAEPSGSIDETRAEAVGGVAGGSPVSPATSGPPINPPSQGNPTNPAQPR